MNPDPNYSAAYLVLETDGNFRGHGLTFTIGRGNEICVAAIEALSALVVGLDLDWIIEDMGRFWRHVTGDSQLRWIGPDKGAIHLATGAVVKAIGDLWAKVAGKPVWLLVSEMTPEEIVRLVDFRYLSDAITHDEALALLQSAAGEKRHVWRGLWLKVILVIPPQRAGWVIPTTSYGGFAVRRGTQALPTQNSRSASALRMTSAVSPSLARFWAMT